MQQKQLGDLWPVSILALGGGGIGQVWGQTTQQEAIATARLAVDQGITLLDMAPSYGRGEAETVIGEAFQGRLPAHVRINSKCLLGTDSAEPTMSKLKHSIKRSLTALQLEAIDLFFLHSQIIPDDYLFPGDLAFNQKKWSVTWSCYQQVVIPAFEALKAEGLIKAWGITGTGLPQTIKQALGHSTKPAAVQVIANLLDSAGGIRRFDGPAEPRNILAAANSNEIGILGIRAVQAGALCQKMDRSLAADHPDAMDYQRAASFRALCAHWAEDPAVIAHRYALAMQVDSVVLGVKNRQELMACVQGAEQGPLDQRQISEIDSLGLIQR